MPGVVPVLVELTVPLPRERAEHTAACECVGGEGVDMRLAIIIRIQSTQIQKFNIQNTLLGNRKLEKLKNRTRTCNSLILTQVGGGPLHVTLSIQVTLWSPDSW